MKLPSFTLRQWIMIATPMALTLSMIAAFQLLVPALGSPLGYLASFAVYWVLWCILLPMFVLGGPRGLLNLFGEGRPSFSRSRWLGLALVWWPLPFPILFRFLPKLPEASVAILALSVVIGVVIAVTEEILWRGVYVKLFPGNLWLGWLYPSIGFSVWHLAPQLVSPNPSPGGIVSFLVFALLLGLTWGYYALRTGSIRTVTMAHAVHDSFGLGAFTYASWLR